MPLLDDPDHESLIQSMTTKLPKVLGLGTQSAPKAIVLVTAHWNERFPTISSGKKPKLYYDYGGFPPESYEIKYDAPGSPEVAKLVSEALRGGGFQPELDEERGMSLFTLYSLHVLMGL
jgi:aromatic ring-opening dioxygenase catalytic subunit (LigB family)